MPILVEYSVNVTNVHILNAYKYSKFGFREIITDIKKMNPDNFTLQNRKNFSIILDWSLNNLLYRFGINREKTRDLDINPKTSMFRKVTAFLLMPLSFLVIK